MRAGTCKGTTSNPPRESGWQRNSLEAASTLPRATPCRAIASAAYSEQVGWKRQAGSINGDSQR